MISIMNKMVNTISKTFVFLITTSNRTDSYYHMSWVPISFISLIMFATKSLCQIITTTTNYRTKSSQYYFSTCLMLKIIHHAIFNESNYLSNMKKTTTHDCEMLGELNQMTNSRWEHFLFSPVLWDFSRLQQFPNQESHDFGESSNVWNSGRQIIGNWHLKISKN